MSKLVSVRINDNNQAMLEYVFDYFKEKYGFEASVSATINAALEKHLLDLTTQIAKERAGN